MYNLLKGNVCKIIAKEYSSALHISLKSKVKQITLKAEPGTCASAQGTVNSVICLDDSSSKDAQGLWSRTGKA